MKPLSPTANRATNVAVRGSTLDFMSMLSDDERTMVNSVPERKREMLGRAFAYRRLGTNARQKWMNGLVHLRQLLTEPGHFVALLTKPERAAVYDVLDLVDEIRAGKHDGERNTDPRLYRVLVDSLAVFDQHHYANLPHDVIMDSFDALPPGERPADPSKWLAETIRHTRLAKNISQGDLAAACGVSRRAIVMLEGGRPTTGKTLSQCLHRLGLLDFVRAPAGTHGRTRKRAH